VKAKQKESSSPALMDTTALVEAANSGAPVCERGHRSATHFETDAKPTEIPPGALPTYCKGYSRRRKLETNPLPLGTSRPNRVRAQHEPSGGMFLITGPCQPQQHLPPRVRHPCWMTTRVHQRAHVRRQPQRVPGAPPKAWPQETGTRIVCCPSSQPQDRR
jgi:hypothetical protein